VLFRSNVEIEASSRNPSIQIFREHAINFRASLQEIESRKSEIYRNEPTRILQSIRSSSNNQQTQGEFVDSLFETDVNGTNFAPFSSFNTSSNIRQPVEILVNEAESIVRRLNIERLAANRDLSNNRPSVNLQLEDLRLRDVNSNGTDLLGLRNTVSNNILAGRDNLEVSKQSTKTIIDQFTEILTYEDIVPISALIEICNISNGATYVVHTCFQHRIMLVVGIPLGFQAFYYLSEGNNFKDLLNSLKQNIITLKLSRLMRLSMVACKRPDIAAGTLIGGALLFCKTNIGLKSYNFLLKFMPKQSNVLTKAGIDLA
jgi:hypothetical protein